MSRLRVSPLWAVALLATMAGCAGESDDVSNDSVLTIPVGFPTPDVPDDNPVTREKAELGRHLFYDVRLSADGTQSCGTCHEQQSAFSRQGQTPAGATGEEHPRHVPSLANTAYKTHLTWANPALVDLEDQLVVPLFGDSPVQLGIAGHEDEVLARLAEDPATAALFGNAFPDDEDPVGWTNVVRALATFVRTMISGNSPFDRFLYQADADAMSPAAMRGMELFFSERLECHHCHGGFNFDEPTGHDETVMERFFNIGLYNLDGKGAYPPVDTGLFAITGAPYDMGRFRTPSLRNIALSGPFMHDGSVATLSDVVRFYEEGGRIIADGPHAGDGRTSPMKSDFVSGFSLTDSDRDDVVSFLESLTDRAFIEDPRFSNPFIEPASR